MLFDYDLCRVSVQKLNECIYFWYIYVFYTKTHITGFSDNIAVVCISTAPFEDTKLPLPQHRKHQKTEKYQGSADLGELYLDPDVNRPVSVNLWQCTTVSSQCERLPYT